MDKSFRQLLFSILLTFSCLNAAKAQVQWFYDLDPALEIARNNGQLVFIDFSASWCGPCMRMDIDVWASDEVTEATSNIVMVKIDVDRHPHYANRYNVSSIPRMFLIDPFENRIDEINSYQDAPTMMRFFNSYPSDISNIVAALEVLEKKENESAENYLVAGDAFAFHLPNLKGKSKLRFSGKAGFYYGKAASKVKKLDNQQLAHEIILQQSRLAMHQDNYKRALKKLSSIDKNGVTKDQKKQIDELCITCLYQDKKPEKAREIYADYAKANEVPKTFDELVKRAQ